MRLKDIIRAPKENIRIGEWHFGKVPKASFPISRTVYRLGNTFKWCVIEFQALGSDCRVLVVFHEPKQKYEAVLGVLGTTGNLRILCSYEYHASEPGWHCHATHDDVDTIPNGVMRGPWVRRVPAARKPHRIGKHATFRIGDSFAAIHFAQKRYNIEPTGALI